MERDPVSHVSEHKESQDEQAYRDSNWQNSGGIPSYPVRTRVRVRESEDNRVYGYLRALHKRVGKVKQEA